MVEKKDAPKKEQEKTTTRIKKNTNGYNYKYSDLAAIHEEMERQKITYWQEIIWDSEAGYDCIYTTLVIDGKEQKPRRGCRVIDVNPGSRSNPAQAQGSGITYARRYSLLMALGWATEDDDASSLNAEQQAPRKTYQQKPAPAAKPNRIEFDEVWKTVKEIDNVEELGKYWASLHLSEAQEKALKPSFTRRREELEK